MNSPPPGIHLIGLCILHGPWWSLGRSTRLPVFVTWNVAATSQTHGYARYTSMWRSLDEMATFQAQSIAWPTSTRDIYISPYGNLRRCRGLFTVDLGGGIATAEACAKSSLAKITVVRL